MYAILIGTIASGAPASGSSTVHVGSVSSLARSAPFESGFFATGSTKVRVTCDSSRTLHSEALNGASGGFLHLPEAGGPGEPWVVAEVDTSGEEVVCQDVLTFVEIPNEICLGTAAHDVNGDGVTDASRARGLPEEWGEGNWTTTVTQYLSTSAGSHELAVASYPAVMGYGVQDLDQDGFADLLTVDYQRERSSTDPYSYYWHDVTTSVTRVYGGSMDGFADFPYAVIEHDRVVLLPVPVQLDDDAELEILALAAEESYSSYSNVRMVVVDVTGPEPTVTVLSDPTSGYGLSRWYFDFAVADDYDGDGVEDIVFSNDRAKHLLGSASGFDGRYPLADLSMYDEAGDLETSDHHILVHDVDQDGWRDLVTAWSMVSDHYFTVTFGPFLEPPTVPHTGHTAHTADTAATLTDTATTATADTGPADTGTPTTSSTVCGCSHRLDLTTALDVITRRR